MPAAAQSQVVAVHARWRTRRINAVHCCLSGHPSLTGLLASLPQRVRLRAPLSAHVVGPVLLQQGLCIHRLRGQLCIINMRPVTSTRSSCGKLNNWYDLEFGPGILLHSERPCSKGYGGDASSWLRQHSART